MFYVLTTRIYKRNFRCRSKNYEISTKVKIKPDSQKHEKPDAAWGFIRLHTDPGIRFMGS